MSQENVAIVRRWFDEVWNRGQLATIHELMAADAVGIGQGGGEVAIRGPQEFQVFVEKLRGAFPDIHVTIEDAFAARKQESRLDGQRQWRVTAIILASSKWKEAASPESPVEDQAEKSVPAGTTGTS